MLVLLLATTSYLNPSLAKQDEISRTSTQACENPIVILLQGINTEYDNWARTFADIYVALGANGFSNRIIYSYDPNNLRSYGIVDTYQTLNVGVLGKSVRGGTPKIALKRPVKR